MQFQIPQFIDVENKIVGPLTLRQFLYLAAGGGISFAAFFMFQTWLWLMVTGIVGTISIVLAFIKYNGQPLPKVLMHALGFFWKPRVYIWQREAEMKAYEFGGGVVDKKGLRDYLGQMPGMKNLMLNLMTSKGPIPKREAGQSLAGAQEKIGIIKKTTGERQAAKRVDYK